MSTKTAAGDAAHIIRDLSDQLYDHQADARESMHGGTSPSLCALLRVWAGDVDAGKMQAAEVVAILTNNLVIRYQHSDAICRALVGAAHAIRMLAA